MLSRFVCVRVVQANGADLALFQFDYDLTFSAFMLNSDRTIYGRFGSRSTNRDAMRDMSMEGFRKALESALEVHRGYPGNKAMLAGKQTQQPPPYRYPEEYPSFKGRYTASADFSGQVGRSCIHCHMVGEAKRLEFRNRKEPLPDKVIYPWPMPDVLGLHFDPGEKATVGTVLAGSPGASAGFEPGDQVVKLGGELMLSIADVQWVLENAPEPAPIGAEVLRGGKQVRLTLKVPKGWRRGSDISWRPTSWDLRRMATGGMVLESLDAEERQAAGLSNGGGLRVKYVGEYGEHAVGKRAGFKKGDILIQFDGREDFKGESDLFGYVLEHRMPGSRVPVTVLREGQKHDFELLMQ